MIAKNKQIFKDTLSGKETARDIFETPMIKGEIILYASASSGSIQMTIAKIIEIKREKSEKIEWPTKLPRRAHIVSYQKIKLKIRRCIKDCGRWQLMRNSSHISKIDNVIVLTNPKPEILRLFKDIK